MTGIGRFNDRTASGSRARDARSGRVAYSPGRSGARGEARAVRYFAADALVETV
ncbi:hypothetical protein [Streptomyces sp. DSM 118878]